LPIIECPDAAKEIETGDEVEVNFDTGVITDKDKRNFLIRGQAFPAIHAEDYRLRGSGQLYQSEIISKYNQKQEDCCINDQVCVTVFLYVARWL